LLPSGVRKTSLFLVLKTFVTPSRKSSNSSATAFEQAARAGVHRLHARMHARGCRSFTCCAHHAGPYVLAEAPVLSDAFLSPLS